MGRLSHRILFASAPVIGFVLSFLALGVLWIGTAWPVQFLMCLPFLFAAYFITRHQVDGRFVLFGVAPIAVLVAQFRDKEGSHAMPILLVCGWTASVLLGWWLARRQGAALRE